MFPQLRDRIQESLAKLEHQLVSFVQHIIGIHLISHERQEQGEQNSPEEITKAKEAVASAKNAINESS